MQEVLFFSKNPRNIEMVFQYILSSFLRKNCKKITQITPMTPWLQSGTPIHQSQPLVDLELTMESLQLGSVKPILLHKCNLAGIIFSHTDMAMIPRFPPALTLGKLVDEYITTHGYNLESICCMAEAEQLAAGDREMFCCILAEELMLVAEALYLHKLISNQQG
jgi:hypothetical protein